MIRIYKQVSSPKADTLTIQNLTTEKSGDGIMVSWDSLDASSGTTAYEVWKKINDGTWELNTNITVLDYVGFTVDLDVVAGNTYHYRVRAKNVDEVIVGYSEIVSFELLEEVPDTPTDLTATIVSPTQVLLGWDAPVDEGTSPITGYKIERKEGATWTVIVANSGSTETSIQDNAAPSGTYLEYRVSAINSVGVGAASNIASVTTPDEDTTAPVITLVGGDITITEGEAYVEPGFSASDDIDGDISANVVINYGGLNTSDPVIGDYTITYNVTDSSDNPATEKSRVVTVEAVSQDDPDFTAYKTRVEADGGTIIDEEWTKTLITRHKAEGTWANLWLCDINCGIKVDGSNGVDKFYDLGSGEDDLNFVTGTKAVRDTTDTKQGVFDNSIYTTGSNYMIATDGIHFSTVCKPTSGSQTSFIMDFGNYNSAGYGLAIGINDINTYLPGKPISIVKEASEEYNVEKTVIEMNVLLGTGDGFSVLKDGIVEGSRESTSVLDLTNIDEATTRSSSSGPFTIGGSSKTSQAGRVYDGLAGHFYLVKEHVPIAVATSIRTELNTYYGIVEEEPPVEEEFAFQRLSYEAFETTSGKHLFCQFYLNPSHLASPTTANSKYVIWTGGLGSNGFDDKSALNNDDGWPKYINNGTDLDYNVISVQQTGGTYSAQDILDIVTFLKSKVPLTNENEIRLIGWSAGHAPNTALKNFPEKVKCAILFDLAYDTIGPASVDGTMEYGSRIWLIGAADSSYVGGVDTQWNAMQASVYFNPTLHKRTNYASGGHNVQNKTFFGTGGASATPDDGYTVYPGDPAYTVHDFIMED